jgi:hypothetical protein
VDVLLALVLVVWTALPFAVGIVPPIVAATYRRTPAAWAALYVVALGLVGANWYALSENMDRADHTGGGGSIFGGAPWLVAAVAAGALACWHAVRTPATVTGHSVAEG